VMHELAQKAQAAREESIILNLGITQ